MDLGDSEILASAQFHVLQEGIGTVALMDHDELRPFMSRIVLSLGLATKSL